MPPDRDAAAEDLLGADHGRRAYRTLNEDGLVDLGVGLGLASVALYVGLHRMAGVSMTGWTGLAPILIMLLLRRLRMRVIYPRIGYVRTRAASPAVLLMAALILLLVAGLVVMTIYARRGVRPPAGLMPWVLRLFALAGAAILAAMGRRTGFARFYAHAGLIATMAPASTVFRNENQGLLALFGLPALVMSVTGLACFLLFLRRHPKPEGFAAGH
jgi:hypothetical protein